LLPQAPPSQEDRQGHSHQQCFHQLVLCLLLLLIAVATLLQHLLLLLLLLLLMMREKLSIVTVPVM